MNPDLKCHFVKQLALYSQRIMYAYLCDMDVLYKDIQTVKRFITIEDNIVECSLKGSIINDLNKYRQSIKTNYSGACRGC
jgi:hypothetical protein